MLFTRAAIQKKKEKIEQVIRQEELMGNFTDHLAKVTPKLGVDLDEQLGVGSIAKPQVKARSASAKAARSGGGGGGGGGGSRSSSARKKLTGSLGRLMKHLKYFMKQFLPTPFPSPRLFSPFISICPFL
jgi:hypothetical protein